MPSPSPRSTLRAAVPFCLVGLGVSAIYETRHMTAGNMQPAKITLHSFGGALAFLGLAIAAFAWNLITSEPEAQAARS